MDEADVGRRGAPRVVVNLPADLEVDGDAWRVSLIDVSQTGAAVGCAVPVELGTAIRLYSGALEMRGIVVWSSTKRVGLQFETLLSAENVRRLRDAGAHSWSAERSIVYAAEAYLRDFREGRYL